VQRVAREISKRWWRSFGYNYVLAAIDARLRELACYVFEFNLMALTMLSLFSGIAEGS
jgi:hypothetical protein